MSDVVAVVTGGTRGIGRYVAELLAGRGYPVSLCGASTAAPEVAREIGRSFGVATLGFSVDLTDLDATATFLAATRAHLGTVGVVVNCAAELGPVGPLSTLDAKAWCRTLQLDVGAVAAMISLCAGDMITAGWGRIVNFAGGGVGGPNIAVGVSAYTTSKFAVCGLTEAVGRELEGTGVAVCALAPGAIGTGFMAHALDADGFVGAAELRAMAEAQRDRPDNPDALGALMHYVLDGPADVLNGRTLSARWETPEALMALGADLQQSRSRYRLRRIDDVLFGELKK